MVGEEVHPVACMHADAPVRQDWSAGVRLGIDRALDLLETDVIDV